MQSNGWDAKPTTGYCIDANLRAQYHTSIMRPERREEMIGTLTSMITYAKERGIEVVLMSTPVCPDYYHATDWEKRLYVEKMTKKLAHQYRLPYLDLAQDDRFHADEFADADHLNAAGASRLSGILNEFLADGME